VTRLTGERRWAVAQLCVTLRTAGQSCADMQTAAAALLGGEEPTMGQIKHALHDYETLRERFEGTNATDTAPSPASGESPSHGPDEARWDTPNDDQPVLARELGWPTYVYGREPEPKIPIPKFTGHWELAGDFVVVGDIHVPTTDWCFAGVMMQIAKQQLAPPRRILIAGDLLNLTALSHFAKRTTPLPAHQEIRAANMFLTALLKVFDELYVFPGNHDVWFMNALSGDIEIDQFARMIIELNERLCFSPYSHAYITSGGERWFIPHQSNYRQNKLSVGTELAAKHGCNIITTHQHHSAIGRDKGDRFTVVDCGGLMEPDLMEYVKMRPSTRPEMTKGFCLLLDGCCHLITPYRTMTDVSRWLSEERVKA
jgi:hypothetical protein